MNHLPAILTPTGEEEILLNNGVVRLPKATPQFSSWSGPILFDRYGGKAVLDFHGEALFAELVILRLFEAEGWSGVWVDSYRRCFRRNPLEKVEVPKIRLRVFEQLREAVGARGGCFDVFMWREDTMLFAEAKHNGRDKFRPTQIRWLEAALQIGLPIKSFLVVEWSLNNKTNQSSSINE